MSEIQKLPAASPAEINVQILSWFGFSVEEMQHITSATIALNPEQYPQITIVRRIPPTANISSMFSVRHFRLKPIAENTEGPR